MAPMRAFVPAPTLLTSSHAVRAPARVPLPFVAATEPTPLRRSVRRRARVRLVPCAVAEPPAAITSASVVRALADGLSFEDRDVPASNEAERSDPGEIGREEGGSSKKSGSDNSQVFRIGKPHTDESRRKISAANKGKVPWNKGRKHSEETKRKIAEATRRAMSLPETRARLRTIATGRKHSVATRSKISSACVRSRAVRHGEESGEDGGNQEGERLLVVGSLSSRRGKRQRLPFYWCPDIVSSINEKIHNRAIATDFTLPLLPSGRAAHGRRPMSLETRAKLSARIKELWSDPSYRQRVQVGVERQHREKGKERGPLSKAHRENIRQSLLMRNANLRAKGVLGPLRPRRSSSMSSRGRPDLAGTKLAGQVVSDDYGKYVAGQENEELSQEARASQRKKQSGKRRQNTRNARKAQKAAEEAERLAAEQRAQDGLLLQVLAAAGQLPSLDGDGGGRVVSGLPANSPVVFGSDGIREAGAGGMFEAVHGASSARGEARASRLVFSSSNAVSNVNGHVDGSAAAEALLVSSGNVSLDFDIYAPSRVVKEVAEEDEEEDDDDDDSIEGEDSSDGDFAVEGPVHLHGDVAVVTPYGNKARNVGELAAYAGASESPTIGTDPEVSSEEDSDLELADVALARSKSTLSTSPPLDTAVDDVGLLASESAAFVGEEKMLSDATTAGCAASSSSDLYKDGIYQGTEERKHVVTYVNGVAEVRYVD